MGSYIGKNLTKSSQSVTLFCFEHSFIVDFVYETSRSTVWHEYTTAALLQRHEWAKQEPSSDQSNIRTQDPRIPRSRDRRPSDRQTGAAIGALRTTDVGLSNEHTTDTVPVSSCPCLLLFSVALCCFYRYLFKYPFASLLLYEKCLMSY